MSNQDENKKGESQQSKISLGEFQPLRIPSTDADTKDLGTGEFQPPSKTATSEGEDQRSQNLESIGEFRRPHLPSQFDESRSTLAPRKRFRLAPPMSRGEFQLPNCLASLGKSQLSQTSQKLKTAKGISDSSSALDVSRTSR